MPYRGPLGASSVRGAVLLQTSVGSWTLVLLGFKMYFSVYIKYFITLKKSGKKICLNCGNVCKVLLQRVWH